MASRALFESSYFLLSPAPSTSVLHLRCPAQLPYFSDAYIYIPVYCVTSNPLQRQVIITIFVREGSPYYWLVYLTGVNEVCFQVLRIQLPATYVYLPSLFLPRMDVYGISP